MLSLKKHIFLSTVLTALAVASKANAGLYGFTEPHPYSQEEAILDMDVPPLHINNYRNSMRTNILMLINYAKRQNPKFQTIVHEGQALLSQSLWERHLSGYNEARDKEINARDPSFLLPNNISSQEPAVGSTARRYLTSIDAIALNNTYCEQKPFAKELLKTHNITIVAIDNCPDETSLDRAIIRSAMDSRLFYGFTDINVAFNNVSDQPVINETAKNVSSVKNAKNILLLTDDTRFADKYELIKELRASNYDIVIISPLFHGKIRYTPEEIRSMQFKKNGTRRLLIAEMNVSEASDTAYYWQPEWQIGKPEWLNRMSFANENAVIVSYWYPEWQKIISLYFKGIVDSGFDGVFFTGIENYRYFEKQTPLE